MTKAYFSQLYVSDQVSVKRYKDKYKIVFFKVPIRQSGFEEKNIFSSRGQVNDSKLDTNIARARQKVFEYAICNDWDWFVTLTINPNKYDRHDLKSYYKDFSKWLLNYQRLNDIKIKYLFIPELHKDGAWHMHGFISGLPESHLKINSNGYLDWFPYKSKFGYISLDRIKNPDACAKYITKYVSKNLGADARELNSQLYYCSKGLQTAQEIKKGTLAATNIPWEFENDFIKIAWTESQNLALSSCESIPDMIHLGNSLRGEFS